MGLPIPWHKFEFQIDFPTVGQYLFEGGYDVVLRVIAADFEVYFLAGQVRHLEGESGDFLARIVDEHNLPG